VAIQFPKPPLPAGFQKPGVPGAGNALDPAVRGELRALIQEAVLDAMRQVASGFGMTVPPEPAPAPPAPPFRGAPVPSNAAPPTAPARRLGPFPHGDVDLSHVTANVPEETPAQRSARGRAYYFLQHDRAARPAQDQAPAATQEDQGHGRKPG